MTDNNDIDSELNGNGETILIIDDEASFLEITKILLSHSGYTILTAKDGIEGLEQFNNNVHSIKVVICDLNMPKMGGDSAVKTFLLMNPDVKILIISGSIEDDKVPKYLERGKIEFLHKPFEIETLLEVLAHLLGKK